MYVCTKFELLMIENFSSHFCIVRMYVRTNDVCMYVC